MVDLFPPIRILETGYRERTCPRTDHKIGPIERSTTSTFSADLRIYKDPSISIVSRDRQRPEMANPLCELARSDPLFFLSGGE